MEQVPSVGRIVQYRLNQYNVESIRERRASGVFQGNPVQEGDMVPMLICQPWGNPQPTSAVNGQAFLDGNDSLWLTSVMCGEGPGTWSWPTR